MQTLAKDFTITLQDNRPGALAAAFEAISKSNINIDGYAEIEAGASKMEKDQLKAKQEEYQARANALQPKIDAFNKARNDRVEVNKAFNTRVDAHQKIADDFNEAVEDLNDKRNEWKLKCGNRSYDEADEIAIKKEMNKK